MRTVELPGGIIEPEAEAMAGLGGIAGRRLDEMLALSIAISLKRIADVVSAPGFDFVTINHNVEQMAWNAGRSFEQGKRTDR